MRGASNNPQIVVHNNTGAVQYVKLFTPSPNALGSLNARTKYIWNLTPETFTGSTMISIDVTVVGSAFARVQTLSAVLSSLTVAGVVAALNTLNVGSFYLQGSLVETSNDRFVFGNLTVNSTVLTPFSVTGGIYGYQVGRYFFNVVGNSLSDQGANQLVVYGSALYVGIGQTRWVLHDSTLTNPDIVFGVQSVSGQVDQGYRIAMAGGYDTILWQSSPDGVSWTNADAGIAVTNTVRGTVQQNGSTASSGTQMFSADLIIGQVNSFGTASSLTFAFGSFRIARVSPSPGGLGAGGSLLPNSGLTIGSTTTGTLNFAPATIAAGDVLTIGVTITGTYVIVSGINPDITNLIGAALGFAGGGVALVSNIAAT